jgi:hypothetical protein
VKGEGRAPHLSPFTHRNFPANLTEFKFIKYNLAKLAAIFVELSPHFSAA